MKNRLGRKAEVRSPEAEKRRRESFAKLYKDGDASIGMCFSMLVPESGVEIVDKVINQVREGLGIPPWQPMFRKG